MNKKITIYGILVLCVAGAILGLMLADQQQTLAVKSSEREPEDIYLNIPKLTPTDIAMKSTEYVSSTGGILQVFFDTENDTAIVNADGQGDVVFTEAVSASGAKYENKSLGMVLWNKGESVTLYQNETVVFEGVSR